ncbi:hypothetical protein GQ600_9966 [Phytophthora cactorum]|nr:hypothetical protein GQ600_9966 [Phytophthora cactorum]
MNGCYRTSSVKEGPIPDNSDSLPNPSEPGEEEATSESDEHIENGLVDLELFGSDDFMEGLRKENIFGPPDGDDVNIGVAGSVDDGESDADDEDVMADNASDSEHVEGIDDIDEDEKNEDDPDTELLGITRHRRRDEAVQVHSGKIVHVIALLFARGIAPVRDGLAKHWSTEEGGRGSF